MSKVIQIKEAASLKDALNDLFIIDDMDYFDNHSSNSFAIYAGLVALNDFLETGEEMLKGDECFDEKDFERRAKNRENNENCIAEYRQVAEKFETTNTAVRIGNKIYFNYDNYVVYVQNLKTGTLVNYTNWNSDAVKAAVPKNGATCTHTVFDQASHDTLFRGCFDANGKQIDFAECFGKQSNVTTFFNYYEVPKRADVILNLFTIRGKYAKLLELAQNIFQIKE